MKWYQIQLKQLCLTLCLSFTHILAFYMYVGGSLVSERKQKRICFSGDDDENTPFRPPAPGNKLPVDEMHASPTYRAQTGAARGKSVMMIGKSLVTRLDNNSSSVKRVIFVFVPFALMLALTNFGSAIMLIRYLKDSEVSPSGNLIGTKDKSIVATRDSTETFDLGKDVLPVPRYDRMLQSDSAIETSSWSATETFCSPEVAEKIYSDCESSISVHLKKQCRSGIVKTVALCGSTDGSHSYLDDPEMQRRLFGYANAALMVKFYCPASDLYEVTSETDEPEVTRRGLQNNIDAPEGAKSDVNSETLCRVDFEPILPFEDGTACECDYECASGYCDSESDTCQDYYVVGSDFEDNVTNPVQIGDGESTASALEKFVITHDNLIAEEVIPHVLQNIDVQTFLNSSSVSNCSALVENIASFLNISVETFETIEVDILSDAEREELASFCEAQEDSTTYLWPRDDAPELKAFAFTKEQVSDLVEDVRHLAALGTNPDQLFGNLTNLTQVVRGELSLEDVENIFDHMDELDGGLASDLIRSAFTEAQNSSYAFLADYLPQNGTEEGDNIFAGRSRFLLKDEHLTGPRFEDQLASIHQEHTERRASRMHQKYVHNAREFRRKLPGHIDHTLRHIRRLATTLPACPAGENTFTCSSTHLYEVEERLSAALEFDIIDEMIGVLATYGEMQDKVDATHNGLTVVVTALGVAKMIPYIGTPFGVPHGILSPIKNVAGKIDRVLTKIDNKVVSKVDNALNEVQSRIESLTDVVEDSARSLSAVGSFVSLQCNPELIENLIGVDITASTFVDPVNSGATAVTNFAHQVADAIEEINAVAATAAWQTVVDVSNFISNFIDKVDPAIKPFAALASLLEREVRIPWLGGIYRKKNLGKAQCLPSNIAGYSSKPGPFGDVCWEVCPSGYEKVSGAQGKSCKPKCTSLHSGSKLKTLGCSSRSQTKKRYQYTKSRKSKCQSGYKHIVYAFEKDQCRKTCEQYQKEASHADKRTYTSWVEMGSTDCIRYAKCKAGHHFTPKGSPTHKYCKREKRHNRSHKRSCSKYTQGKSYTARLNYVTNNCMKQCAPGDGETPLGICNKKAELRFKISDIFDHFQAIMDKVAGFILTAIENGLKAIVNAVLNPILKALGIKTISLPDLSEVVPDVSFPSLPSIPDFTALEKVEEVTETIVDFPETIYDSMMDKIPSSLPLDVFDNVQDMVESANIFFDDMKALNDVTASILGDISGCSETEIIQVPSLVTLFKEAGLGDGWDDCKIEVPLCTKLDMPDVSNKLTQLARLLAQSKFVQLLKIQSGNRRLSAEEFSAMFGSISSSDVTSSAAAAASAAAKKFLETVFKFVLNDSIGLDYDAIASGNYTLSIPLLTLDWSFLKYAREMNMRGKSSLTLNEYAANNPIVANFHQKYEVASSGQNRGADESLFVYSNVNIVPLFSANPAIDLTFENGEVSLIDFKLDLSFTLSATFAFILDDVKVMLEHSVAALDELRQELIKQHYHIVVGSTVDSVGLGCLNHDGTCTASKKASDKCKDLCDLSEALQKGYSSESQTKSWCSTYNARSALNQDDEYWEDPQDQHKSLWIKCMRELNTLYSDGKELQEKIAEEAAVDKGFDRDSPWNYFKAQGGAAGDWVKQQIRDYITKGRGISAYSFLDSDYCNPDTGDAPQDCTDYEAAKDGDKISMQWGVGIDAPFPLLPDLIPSKLARKLESKGLSLSKLNERLETLGSVFLDGGRLSATWMMDSQHFEEFPVIDEFSLGAWRFSRPETRSGLDHLSKTLQVTVIPLSASTTAIAAAADVADLFKDIGEGFVDSLWSDSSPYSF